MADVLRLPFHSLRFCSRPSPPLSVLCNRASRPIKAHTGGFIPFCILRLHTSLSDPESSWLISRYRQPLLKETRTSQNGRKEVFRIWLTFILLEEFLSALGQAGDRLVIVEFYGTWCASCRALFPKFQKLEDAIALHNTARCSIGRPKGVGDLGDLILEPSSAPKDKPSESASS